MGRLAAPLFAQSLIPRSSDLPWDQSVQMTPRHRALTGSMLRRLKGYQAARASALSLALRGSRIIYAVPRRRIRNRSFYVPVETDRPRIWQSHPDESSPGLGCQSAPKRQPILWGRRKRRATHQKYKLGDGVELISLCPPTPPTTRVCRDYELGDGVELISLCPPTPPTRVCRSATRA